MDPKLVVSTPPDNVLTPNQRKAFAIRDRYIEQNIPCYVTWTNLPIRHVEKSEGITADDDRPTLIYLRNNYGFVRLDGWQDPDGEVRMTKVEFVKQDVRLELNRQEELFLSQQFDGSESLPLRDEDFSAIGITDNAHDATAEDQDSSNSADSGNKFSNQRGKR